MHFFTVVAWSSLEKVTASFVPASPTKRSQLFLVTLDVHLGRNTLKPPTFFVKLNYVHACAQSKETTYFPPEKSKSNVKARNLTGMDRQGR